MENLPAKDFKYIIDKRAYFHRHSISQLKISRHLENIRGATELWELKFHWRTEYRAVCIIRENKIVMLDMFKGSGSAGRGVTKYIPKCLQRAEDWNKRCL